MHQRLVVTVLIARTELQVLIEEEPQVVLPFRQHDALITRLPAEDHVIRVQLVVGGRRDRIRVQYAHGQSAENGNAGGPQRDHPPDLLAKQPRGPQRYARVHEAEQQRRAHQSQLRNQPDREQDRRAECAQIIERQNAGNQFAKLQPVLQNAHQQRNLEAHQHADGDHNEIEQQPERLRVGEGEEQHGGRESAHQPDHQFDRYEARHQPARDEFGHPASDAHSEQVAAYDGGELQNAVAQQIAGQRAGNQLINESARGDQEYRKEKGYRHALDIVEWALGPPAVQSAGNISARPRR